MSDAKNQDILKEDAALRASLQKTGICMLVVGILAAAVAFFLAPPDDESGAVGYEVIDGKSYAVMPADSKRYEHDMEAIGGKSAVLGAELMDWFRSLWHGKRLAATLACLGAGGFLACFFLAGRLSFAPLPDNRPGGKGA